jgi:hypothetical protein
MVVSLQGCEVPCMCGMSAVQFLTFKCAFAAVHMIEGPGSLLCGMAQSHSTQVILLGRGMVWPLRPEASSNLVECLAYCACVACIQGPGTILMLIFCVSVSVRGTGWWSLLGRQAGCWFLPRRMACVLWFCRSVHVLLGPKVV